MSLSLIASNYDDVDDDNESNVSNNDNEVKEVAENKNETTNSNDENSNEDDTPLSEIFQNLENSNVEQSNDQTSAEETVHTNPESPSEELITEENGELNPQTIKAAPSNTVLNFIESLPKTEDVDTYKKIEVSKVTMDEIFGDENSEANKDEAGPSSSVTISVEAVEFIPNLQDVELADERGCYDWENWPAAFIDIEPIPQDLLDSLKNLQPNESRGRKRKAADNLSPVSQAKKTKNSSVKIEKQSPGKVEEKKDKKNLKEILGSNSKDKKIDKKQTLNIESGPSSPKKKDRRSETSAAQKTGISKDDLDEMNSKQMIAFLKENGYNLGKSHNREFYKKKILVHLVSIEENSKPKTPKIQSPEHQSSSKKMRTDSIEILINDPTELPENASPRRSLRSSIATPAEVVVSPIPAPAKRGRPLSRKSNAKHSLTQELVNIPETPDSSKNDEPEKKNRKNERPKSGREVKENLHEQVERYKKLAEEHKKSLDEKIQENSALQDSLQKLTEYKDHLLSEIIQLKAEKITQTVPSLCNLGDLSNDANFKLMFKQFASQLQMPLRELAEKVKRLEENSHTPSSSRSLQPSVENTPSPDVMDTSDPTDVWLGSSSTVPNFVNSINPVSQSSQVFINTGKMQAQPLLIPLANGTSNGYVFSGSSNSPISTNHFCPICSAGYSSKRQLQDHILVHQTPPVTNKIIKCEYCGAEFDVQTHYRAHVTYCSQTTSIQ